MITTRRTHPRRGPADIPADRWRNPLYLQFLREECRCSCCGEPNRHGMDPAHGPVNGMRSKGPDAEAVPLCRDCHDQQHRLGWEQFEDLHCYDRQQVAAQHWVLFLVWQEGLAQ